MHFELVSPERILFSGEVDAVLLPATEGDMTVMPGHAPAITTLKAGFVVATDSKNHGERVLVRGGFAEINAAGVIVLAERATPVEELTPERIDREITELQTRRDGTDDDFARRAYDETIGQLEEARETLKL
nr:ATP synthase F1 subunit epsilon [Enterovirga sp. DB1703]